MIDKPINILIVEDDEDDYFLLKSSLKETSFVKNISWASTFEKAKELLNTQSFDLALIDYKLGAHTGIDLIRFINDAYPFIPSILLTGLKESAIDSEALRSGAYDYLIKGQYTSEALDRSMRYAIEKSRVLKSLKESENKFRNLFENAVEYVFFIDSEYIVLDANKAALRLFGYETKEEIIGLKIYDQVFSGILKSPQHSISSIPLGNQIHNIEVEVKILEQNKRRSCILNLSKVEADKNFYQLVLHDITERKLTEHKEKLLEKQALTGKVARIVAHEIKNPLTNIQLSLSEIKFLYPTVAGNDNELLGEFIDIIERNSRRINNLIEDLLNATRFDTLELKEVSVEDILSETIALARDRINLKDIQVETNIVNHLKTKGDKEKLVIAILNILVNAVEAVPEKKGIISISTTSTPDSINIHIRDNGKGIPQEDIDKLFEPFFTSKKGGTGLGLAAAYNIINKHDGSIKVSSRLGEGTAFTIALLPHSPGTAN